MVGYSHRGHPGRLGHLRQCARWRRVALNTTDRTRTTNRTVVGLRALRLRQRGTLHPKGGEWVGKAAYGFMEGTLQGVGVEALFVRRQAPVPFVPEALAACPISLGCPQRERVGCDMQGCAKGGVERAV